MSLMLLVASAFAEDDCELTAMTSVSSNMTMLFINGQPRSVKGRTNWERLAGQLRDCDLDVAANSLERWRTQRRTTNWLVGVGLFTFGPLVAAPFTGSAAGRWREDLEDRLARVGVAREPCAVRGRSTPHAHGRAGGRDAPPVEN